MGNRISAHLYQSTFRNESRILKETRSLVDSGIADHCYIAAMWEPGLLEYEELDPERHVIRFPKPESGRAQGEARERPEMPDPIQPGGGILGTESALLLGPGGPDASSDGRPSVAPEAAGGALRQRVELRARRRQRQRDARKPKGRPVHVGRGLGGVPGLAARLSPGQRRQPRIPDESWNHGHAVSVSQSAAGPLHPERQQAGHPGDHADSVPS